MRNKVSIIIFTLTAAMAFSSSAAAQTSAAILLEKADSARLDYDFPLAADLCRKAFELMDSTSRTRNEDRMIMAQNGLNMMEFCSQPTVLAKQVTPLKDFFLYYPLPNLSWRKNPNQLDSLGKDRFCQAVYFPEGSDEIYWSAADADHIRNIYRSSRRDSLWSVPELINEQITSSSDEIYPMLSPDGETLYFASKGLYGMGGYDLYSSRWNPETGDWGVPVNMGFPYSSPYDDFLFIDSPDGKYSVFASNRGCSADSVCIYVLEYDEMPVRKAVSDVVELRRLSSLRPSVEDYADEGTSENYITDSAGEERYLKKLKEARSLRDSLSSFSRNLDLMRNAFASASDTEKEALSDSIQEKEIFLTTLNSAVQKAVSELQDIEMEFLANGIVLEAGTGMNRNGEGSPSAGGYSFIKKDPGPSFRIAMMKPKAEFDYSLMFLPKGRFAEDNTLPDGIVYQIQIFTQSRKATQDDLRGLSPVFERIHPSGKYVYSAGLFRNYKTALDNINKVKKAGFKDAVITAFHNGQPVGVAQARELEARVHYSVRIFPENGQSLPEQVLALLREHSDKDLIKSIEAGSVIFRTGPFVEKPEAEALAEELKAAGAGTVSIEETPIR